MRESFYVYLITNILNSSVYVGYTSDPKARWKKHNRPSVQRRYSHYHLYRSMAKHGKDNFRFTILEEHESKESALAAEVDIIAMFRATGVPLLNMTGGGEGLRDFSPEFQAERAKAKEQRRQVRIAKRTAAKEQRKTERAECKRKQNEANLITFLTNYRNGIID